MTASKITTLVASLFLLLSSPIKSFAADTFSAADAQQVRALFLRQATAETAHDLAGIDGVLAHAAPGQSDPVNFIARAYRFWGREAVVDHFRTTFAGTWKFEPDQDAIRITPIGADVAHIYAPTKITIGAAGQPGTQYQFLVNEFAIRTVEGWRISTIVPVPAQ
jgi:SnoaL-like domain